MARKLESTERGLDSLVGVVIIIASVCIGFLALNALYALSMDPPAGSNTEDVAVGLVIAVVGSLLAFGITTLVYLVRIATARRSFTAPLWGLVLMSIFIVIGYFVMGGS